MPRLEDYLHSFRLVYPDHTLESVEFNHQGQNNDVLVVNGELVLRFPRYAQRIEELKVVVFWVINAATTPVSPKKPAFFPNPNRR